MGLKTWTGSGYADITGLQGGDDPATAAYIWDGGWVQVWSAVPPWQDSGITKVGEQILTPSTWTQMTGWSVRSGYPGTVIESNGIRIPQTGQFRIRGSFKFGVTAAIAVKYKVRITVDGTPVAGSEAGTDSKAGVEFGPTTLTIPAGLLHYEVWSSGVTYIIKSLTIQPTDTWLTIERA